MVGGCAGDGEKTDGVEIGKRQACGFYGYIKAICVIHHLQFAPFRKGFQSGRGGEWRFRGKSGEMCKWIREADLKGKRTWTVLQSKHDVEGGD